MRSIPLPSGQKLRCAPYHESTGADPVGSAGSYDAFLCVEVPLPWTHDISGHQPFASLGATASIAGADGRTWRPQGLVPRGDTHGSTRVLAYEQPGSERHGSERHARREVGAPYVRREWWVAPARVAELCRALVGADPAAVASFDAAVVPVDDAVLDVLVCTHGRRDVCCGGLGTMLHDALLERIDGDASVRLFRVSHTGGHRFAPTALTFPDGYAWAHLDPDTATQLVRRDGPVEPLLGHCRGVASLAGPAAQVADRVALGRLGWRWCAATRSAVELDRDPGGRWFDVEVQGRAADGAAVSARVRVEQAGEIAQPTCREPLGEQDPPMSPVWRAGSVQ